LFEAPKLLCKVLLPLSMELYNLLRRAIDERAVLQFLFDRTQLLFDFRDLFVEPLALGRAVNLNNEQDLAKRGCRDRSSDSGFEFWINDQVRRIEQSRDCLLLAR